jgi:hypothetical protein
LTPRNLADTPDRKGENSDEPAVVRKKAHLRKIITPQVGEHHAQACRFIEFSSQRRPLT